MSTQVRLRKSVSIEDLGLPPPKEIKESRGLPVKTIFDYASIRVHIQEVWEAAGIKIADGGYIRTVLDQGEDGMALTRTLVTSAQLKDLVANPVTLVPAPGSGKALVVTVIFADYKYGTATYANVGGVLVAIGDGTYFQAELGGLAAASSRSEELDLVTAPATRTLSENLPLVLKNTTTDATTGDGTLTLTVLYATVDLS